MVSNTRGNTRKDQASKQPYVSDDDGSFAGVPSHEHTETTSNSSYVKPQGKPNPRLRDEVSRLSEGLGPLNLQADDTPNNQVRDNELADGHGPVGQHVRDIIATINRLEVLGLQKLNIPLPRCVVLGDQSTGKSSCIEAISGITTPRSDDTCTRCPLFIKIEPSSKPDSLWVAKVSLRHEFVYDGRSGEGPDRLFPGWLRTVDTTERDFATTHSRSELQQIIAQAQMAIICPSLDPSRFASKSPPFVPEHERCDFSPNIVCISITAPELPTLSFYDLPGIIGQSEDPKKQFLVKFVQDLVKEYIVHPDALVLLTCSLGTDIATSTASGIARRVHSEGRCIGVLTKPDCIPPGSRPEKLCDVLDGKRFALGHGYFIVRNLSQAEINEGMTHQDARELERKFFQDIPWTTTFCKHNSRFGTANLQEYLSRRLAANVSEKLPIIREEIESLLGKVETELKTIPEPPSHNAVSIVSDLVSSFTIHIRQEMERDWDHTEWWHTWEQLQQSLGDVLQKMKPTLRLRGDKDKGLYLDTLPGRTVNESIMIDDEDAIGDVRMSSTPETPAKKRKRENETPGPAVFKTPTKTPVKTRLFTPSLRPGPAKSLRQPSMFKPDDFLPFKRQFSLDEITQEINAKSKSKMPGKVHHKVMETLSVQATDQWNIPVRMLLDSLGVQLEAWMKTVFEKHFGDWKGASVYSKAWEIVLQLLKNNINEQKTVMAVDTLNDQSEGPYIYDRKPFNREKTNFEDKYKQYRPSVRMRLYIEEMETHFKRGLEPKELENIKKDVKVKELIADDPYPVDIIFDVMSDVAAYYEIAASRMHDQICMRVESKFFKQLRHELKSELQSNLGIFDGEEGPKAAQRLLAESPEREQHRQDLVRIKASLNEGLNVLEDLRMKYQDVPFLQTNASGGIENFSNSARDSYTTPHVDEMEDVDGLRYG